MTDTIFSRPDFIDSRDVIREYEDLKEERDDLEEALRDAEDEDSFVHCNNALEAWDADNYDSLELLKDLVDTGEANVPDWEHGEQLIREDCFTNHAQELAWEIENVNESRWPYTAIDWDEAADQLRQDYVELDFMGTTYLVRG